MTSISTANLTIFIFQSPNSSTPTEEFLIKAMKHQISECSVCSDQINPATKDVILEKITLPEQLHTEFNCGGCNNSLKGNVFRCLTCFDFVNCEECLTHRINKRQTDPYGHIGGSKLHLPRTFHKCPLKVPNKYF